MPEISRFMGMIITMYCFNVEPLLQYPVYRELEKQEVFDTARLNGGTITWLNGAIDVSPEKVYEISYPYEG